MRRFQNSDRRPTLVGCLLAPAILVASIGCADSSSLSTPEGQYQTVGEIVSLLREAGISCEHLRVRDAAQIAKEEAVEPEYSPPPGAVSIKGPSIRESGLCQFEGSPEVLGEKLSSTITVYEDDEHLKSIPEEHGFPGIALIYGDNWAISLTIVDLARDVADSLDGRVLPAAARSQDADVAGIGPRCFFLAALPPGLAAAAKEGGIPSGDPAQVAQAIGESAYYLPTEVQREISGNCRRGLKLQAAVSADADLLPTPHFEDFWMDACQFASNDPMLTNELGFKEGYAYTELGDELTDRFLANTSLNEGKRRSLATKCGRAVKEAAIGDLD